ncbi:MAG: redoxin domain-containing protein [Planctomycetes bacterium]|nr:redoxin domain-containing protein [Planctomycetota bacterium]MBI3833273.1 redoxin domain-containing protein [Planctomycetota bacterium]
MSHSPSYYRRFLNIIIASLSTSIAHAESPPTAPVKGQLAPEVKVEKLLNSPEGAGTSWQALRGKVVVLEFWATYCAPCVGAIPLMNQLEEEFANQPIVFLHITNEDEATIRKFLETRPIHGWIGIDTEKATMKAYGIKGLPRSVVVGKDGRLLGWTTPFQLVNDPEMLKSIIETGSSPRLTDTPPALVDPLQGVPRAEQESNPKDSLCDIVIRRSTSNHSKFDSGGGSLGDSRFGERLLGHISYFWDVPEPRIVVEATMPPEKFDIVTRTKKADMPEFRDAMHRLIEVTFEISVTPDKRTMDTYALRVLPGREPQLAPLLLSGVYTDESKELFAPSKAIFERMKAGEHFFIATGPLNMLANSVSAEVNKPVLAELGDLSTKYDGVYIICFPYEKGKVASFIDGLQKNVGLALVSERREVDVWVVRKAGTVK